jgi:hypothetical protein
MGLFRSPFIIETLSCHFLATKGNIPVKSLSLNSENPRNAIAMAAAAVCFLLFKAGAAASQVCNSG